MTVIDFLAQANGWQWLGCVCLTALIGGTLVGCCNGLGRFRFKGDVTRTKNVYRDTDKIESNK